VGSFPCVAMGAPAGVDGAAHVVVLAETLMYRDSDVLPAAWRCLVNGRVLGGAHRGHALDGVGLVSPRQRAFCLLRRRTLEQRANFLAGLVILGHCGLWKAMQQGGCCGDVLAGSGKVRKGPIVGEDPLMYGAGRGAWAPPVFAAFNLVIDVHVFPNEPLPGLIDLLLTGP